jgi:hypothetical protein
MCQPSHHTVGLLPHNAWSKRVGICCIIDIHLRNQLVTVDIVKLSYQPRINMCKQLINHKLNCSGCWEWACKEEKHSSLRSLDPLTFMESDELYYVILKFILDLNLQEKVVCYRSVSRVTIPDPPFCWWPGCINGVYCTIPSFSFISKCYQRLLRPSFDLCFSRNLHSL